MDSMTTFTFHNFLLLRYHLPKHYRSKLTGDRFGDDMEFSAPFAPGRVLCHRQLYRRDLHPPDYLSAKLSGVYGSGF